MQRRIDVEIVMVARDLWRLLINEAFQNKQRTAKEHNSNGQAIEIILIANSGTPPYVCSRRIRVSASSNTHIWGECRGGHQDHVLKTLLIQAIFAVSRLRASALHNGGRFH